MIRIFTVYGDYVVAYVVNKNPASTRYTRNMVHPSADLM